MCSMECNVYYLERGKNVFMKNSPKISPKEFSFWFPYTNIWQWKNVHCGISVAQTYTRRLYSKFFTTMPTWLFIVYHHIVNTICCCSEGSSDQPIWLTNAACPSNSSCLSSCASCQSSEVTTCQHSQDIYVHSRESLVCVLQNMWSVLLARFFMPYVEYNPDPDQDGSTFGCCKSMSIGWWILTLSVYFNKFVALRGNEATSFLAVLEHDCRGRWYSFCNNWYFVG